MTRFDAEAQPLTRQKEIVSWLMPLLCLLLLGVGGWVIAQSLRTPLPPAVSSPIVSASDKVFAMPHEARFPERLVVIMITHTPTLPPVATPDPTYAMSTMPPAALCGTWVVEGEVCVMPRLPITPTPYPDCPTYADDQCVWRGTLYATPVRLEEVK